MPLEFPGGAWWPERRTWVLSGHPFVNAAAVFPMDAGLKLHAIVVQVPFTGTLRGFGILLTWRSGIGPGSAFTFGFESVNASGEASGTTLGTPVVLDDTAWPAYQWFEAECGPVAVTKGDLVAVTVRMSVEGLLGTGHVAAVYHPDAGVQQPPYHMHSNTYPPVAPYVWSSTRADNMFPSLALLYTDATLSGPPLDCLTTRWESRMTAGTFTAPVGMTFTVPVYLRVDAIAFNFRPTSPVTLSLTGPGVSESGTLAASAGFGNYQVTFAPVTLSPGVTYTATITPEPGGSFQINGFRLPESDDSPLDRNYEGGETWRAFGDPLEDYTDRWFFYLHTPGLGEPPGGGMTAIAGCSTTFTPEPCDPHCPPDPPGLTLEAVEVRAAFTSAFWLMGLGTAPSAGAVAMIAGCAALTFVNEPCGGIAAAPEGPGVDGCEAPLGLFILGETCLGVPSMSPTRARRVARRWSRVHG